MEFSLAERLADAAEQRRIAAGLPASRRPEAVQPPRLAPVPEPEAPQDEAEAALAELIVDLRDPTSVLAYTPESAEPADEPAEPEASPLFRSSSAAASLPVWQGGAKRAGALSARTGTGPADAPCPNCGGALRLDDYDLVTAVAHVTCTNCRRSFTRRRKA